MKRSRGKGVLLVEGQVVVLHGILEYLLQGAGTAWGVDDASLGEGEYAVLAAPLCYIFCVFFPFTLISRSCA